MEISAAIYRCLLLLLLCSNCRGCMDEEWNALQQIKSSINNPIGTAFSNWYGKDCCRWEGVKCNVSTNRVSTIYIIQKRDPSLEESWYPNASLFAQFDYLKELKLSGNNIGGFTSPHGRVPLSIFANLSRLNNLDISRNSHLEIQPEAESPSWFPSFSLNGLKLGGCNLKSIPSFISQQQNLRFLDLSNNSLSGPFPEILYNISSQLTALDISDNFLHGELPDDVGRIFPQLHYLNVSFNNFNGKLPPSMDKMNQLVTLDMSDNEFLGEIPHGMTSNGSCLEYLRLSRNKLRGDALPQNSSLPNLKWLYLHNNEFSGTFPASLSKSMNLLIVDIQNNDLSGELISDFPALPQLRALLLGGGNRFEGPIPHQLCQMRHLHNLDLSGNNLSGELPTCLDNITSWTEDLEFEGTFEFRMTFEMVLKGFLLSWKRVYSYLRLLDISSNRLEGTIPIEMTHLISLRGLNISNNLLTGEIPISFGNLTTLESLDLSHNKLVGKLPSELTHLMMLSSFNVSFNNLSGPIPQGNQIDTFVNDSYLGNPCLCGRPLSRSCNIVETAKTSGCFFSNMATVYALLFWGVSFLVCSV
ncbi:hypothetical protein COLO4_33049 [Corchorus olitorius]|uniref:Leucine-rich repeat-containing N-terminal plant-type domain-containing protein n=1 Tax=Corchorus olitorius TaxID=93759 RepID=A0A1R3GWN6_9ROSI|nr:hypothetical protein COLO4_33049 [Corchorus olitorius]